MGLTDVLSDVAPPSKAVGRETDEEAADRLGIDVDDAKALRGSLGCHYAELAAVEDTDDGLTVTYADGSALVFVPFTAPDGNGNTGWLFVARPDGRKANDAKAPAYTTPVFARPAADEGEPAPKPVRKAAAKKTADTE